MTDETILSIGKQCEAMHPSGTADDYPKCIAFARAIAAHAEKVAIQKFYGILVMNEGLGVESFAVAREMLCHYFPESSPPHAKEHHMKDKPRTTAEKVASAERLVAAAYAIRDAEREAERATPHFDEDAIRACINAINGGYLTHDRSPEAKFARDVCAMLERKFLPAPPPPQEPAVQQPHCTPRYAAPARPAKEVLDEIERNAASDQPTPRPRDRAAVRRSPARDDRQDVDPSR